MGAHSDVECAISCCKITLVVSAHVIAHQCLQIEVSGELMLMPHPFWHLNDHENFWL